MHRTAPRLARILACGAVPVMLVATGCSDDSGSKKKDSSSPSSAASSATASPTVKAAAFSKLPEACKEISTKTVEKLVPNVKEKNGKVLKPSRNESSTSCMWNGTDDDDIKNMQYRYLTVDLNLFPSHPTLGSGDQRATAYVTQEADKAAKAEGAKNVKTGTADGVGDQAATVKAEARRDGDNYRDQRVVARTANAVVTVQYNGAGFQGAKSPDADELLKQAETAAKEALASVAAINK
ncbi:DUF3558 domain-containing protein [Streptomyces sp. NPDC050617]|uniref:DUF3558 domain-containing protein n=1 Tax=Streptomyces sp. NPDC050617 TaxID=3154628 RepID=UPI00341CB72C